MKKLDLKSEIYIAEERIFPENTKSATYIYPKILKDNSILKENIFDHTIEMFEDYFTFKHNLHFTEKQRDDCLFDIEKNEVEITMCFLFDKTNRQKALIDEGISPFTWEIYKDVDMYSHEIDHYVKDDYVLILKYKKKEPDE